VILASPIPGRRLPRKPWPEAATREPQGAVCSASRRDADDAAVDSGVDAVFDGVFDRVRRIMVGILRNRAGRGPELIGTSAVPGYLWILKSPQISCSSSAIDDLLAQLAAPRNR